jgi:hypothetical protein
MQEGRSEVGWGNENWKMQNSKWKFRRRILGGGERKLTRKIDAIGWAKQSTKVMTQWVRGSRMNERTQHEPSLQNVRGLDASHGGICHRGDDGEAPWVHCLMGARVVAVLVNSVRSGSRNPPGFTKMNRVEPTTDRSGKSTETQRDSIRKAGKEEASSWWGNGN